MLLSLNDRYDLSKKIENLPSYYSFFESYLASFSGLENIIFRQILTEDDFLFLSHERKRIYESRDSYEHFQDIYKSDLYLEEQDFNSYIFICEYEGRILGIQRISDNDFSIVNYLSNSEISSFLGENYSEEYLEFSRLAVEKRCPIKRLSSYMGLFSGSLVFISSHYCNYTTFSKTRLKPKQLSLDENAMPFTMDGNENDTYLLLKGSMLKDMKRGFSLNSDDRDGIAFEFQNLIKKKWKENE